MRRRALLLLFLGAVLPVVARPQVPDGKWWKRPRIAERIGLTAEQSVQIEKIFRASRPGLIDRKADLEKKQLELEAALEDKAADRQDVEKRIDDVEDARKQLQKARALMILDMKQVLSAEQWRQLAQMREEARDQRRQRRGQGPSPDGPSDR